MIYTSNIPEGLIPANDRERLQALYKYQILNTEPEEVYDRIAEEAAVLFNSPRGFVNFVDRENVFFKGTVGKSKCMEIPRYASFSSIAIHNEQITLFADTLDFPQLKANPFVNGSKNMNMLRFFVAAPLRTPEGLQLGVVGVTDDVPHEVTEAQLKQLWVLAERVMTELNQRLRLQQILKDQLPN